MEAMVEYNETAADGLLVACFKLGGGCWGLTNLHENQLRENSLMVSQKAR